MVFCFAGSTKVKLVPPAAMTRFPGASEELRVKYVIVFEGVSVAVVVRLLLIGIVCGVHHIVSVSAYSTSGCYSRLTFPFSVTDTVERSTAPTVVVAMMLLPSGSALKNLGVMTICYSRKHEHLI